MWLAWLATKTTGGRSPENTSRPSIRRRTYQAITGPKKPERIVSRAKRAGAHRAHGMSSAAHLISRPRSRALRAVRTTRSWAASRARWWGALFSAMARSTPPSHPGYHCYSAGGAQGGYDVRMATEDDRAAEDAQRAAHPPFADRVDDREHRAQPEQ